MELNVRVEGTFYGISREYRKKMDHCKLHSHKWRTLHCTLQSVYKKMGFTLHVYDQCFGVLLYKKTLVMCGTIVCNSLIVQYIKS